MSVDRPLGAQEQLSPVVDEPQRAGPRKVLMGLGLLIVLAALVWGGYWWLHGRFIESTDDAYLAADSMTVAPKVGGYVTEVLVADNQTVELGQPLVRLDARKYQAALDEALATVASREADVAKAEADLVQQDASIAQARAELAGRAPIPSTPVPRSIVTRRWPSPAPKPKSAWPSSTTSSPRPPPARPRTRPRCNRRRPAPASSRRNCNRPARSWWWPRPAPASRSWTWTTPRWSAPWPAAWLTAACG